MMIVKTVMETMVQSVWLCLKARNALFGFTKRLKICCFHFFLMLCIFAVYLFGGVAAFVLTIACDLQAHLRCC